MTDGIYHEQEVVIVNLSIPRNVVWLRCQENQMMI